jgi:hypothetical protein
VQKLKAGLPLLQHPYSDAAAVEVHKLLKAAYPLADATPTNKQPLRQRQGSVVSQLLDLLNGYLCWLLPKAAAHAVLSPTDIISSHDEHSSSPGVSSSTTESSSSMGAPGSSVICAPLDYPAPVRGAGVFLCMLLFGRALAAAQGAGLDAAVRPCLVAAETGEHCACLLVDVGHAPPMLHASNQTNSDDSCKPSDSGRCIWW